MQPTTIILLSVLGVAVLLLIWILGVRFRLNLLRSGVERAFDIVRGELDRRIGMTDPLLDAVRKGGGNASLVALAESARAAVLASGSSCERFMGDISLSCALKAAIASLSDEQREDESFSQLLEQLRETEEQISHDRKSYNRAVKAYRTLRESFPANIVAKLFRFRDYPFFSADEDFPDGIPTI